MSGNSMGTTPGQGTMGTGGKLGASQNPFANEPGRDANGQLIPGYGTLPPGTMLDFPMDNPQGNIPQQPPMAPPQSGTPGRPVPVAPMTPMGPGLANPGGAGVGQTQTPQMGGGSPGMGGKGGIQPAPRANARGDFFDSDEYKKLNSGGLQADSMDMYTSPYFGQGGGSVSGGSRDRAYEAYLQRTGQKAGYGINKDYNMFDALIGGMNPGINQPPPPLQQAQPQQPPTLAQRQPNMPARLQAPPRVGPGPMNPPPSAGRGSNAGRGPSPQKVRVAGAGRGGMIRR